MRLAPFSLAAVAALATFAVPAVAHGPAGLPAVQTNVAVSARGAAAVVDAFHAALRRADLRAAAALLAEDALVFEEGGVERTKTEYASHHLPADAAFSKLVASTIVRRTGSASGTYAWIATEGRMSGTYNGKAVNRKTTETMVLRRAGRGWQIVHVHWSSAAAS